MCTSMQRKPASMNANAISACPFVPCSLSMATFGFLAKGFNRDFRGRISSDGLNVSLYESPGSDRSAIVAYSSSAHAGLSLSFCIR